jgi:hypothetical protein
MQRRPTTTTNHHYSETKKPQCYEHKSGFLKQSTMKDEVTNKPNIPPAFPTIGDVSHSPNWVTEYGMNLLDYFAAKAMQAQLINRDPKAVHSDIAANAYEYAAAMLAEREKLTHQS